MYNLAAIYCQTVIFIIFIYGKYIHYISKAKKSLPASISFIKHLISLYMPFECKRMFPIFVCRDQNCSYICNYGFNIDFNMYIHSYSFVRLDFYFSYGINFLFMSSFSSTSSFFFLLFFIFINNLGDL